VVMKKFLPSLQEHKLSAQQWRVIRALQDENGLDISELSIRCHLLMPSLSRIIQNLESRSLVERRTSSSDNRRSVIYLTKKGGQLFELIAPKSSERYDYITEKFGYGKLELLYELLEELVQKIDDDDDAT
ncbi:homoprotocatechuate degradation operon regulator HpaR, partial [Congregibacter sp.]|uniref:homoprotocatechuate degradation operon regulator HpaR n=1 Tax=Congregibacter sp. TaxID=2744308 RepID=UPI00385CCF75